MRFVKKIEMSRFRRLRPRLVTALCVLAVCTACEPRDPEAWISSAIAQSADDPTRLSEELFATGCASCHGASGRGNGAMTAELGAVPPDFSDPTWQRSVSDDQIDRSILAGGEAVGLSSYMPAFPELRERPELVLALRNFIRGLGHEPDR